MPKRSVIVLPDDTGKPIVDAINAAKKSLRIKMFVFSDPDLIAAVIAAQKRGVKVQVMLRRTFRRDEGQKAHLHAGVTCEHCKTEWWSAHAMALEVSRKLDAEDRESEVIGPFVTRGDKELPQNKRVPLYSKGVVHAD